MRLPARPALLLVCTATLGFIAGCTPIPLDLSDFEVQLSRNGQCFNCPWYTVLIRHDGLVRFQGIGNTEAKGERYALLPHDSIVALGTYLMRQNVFELSDEYETRKYYDGGVTTISIRLAGRRKVIRDQFGAPEIVHRVEQMIDAISGAQDWVGKGAEPPSPNQRESKVVRRQIDSLEAADDEMLQRYESLRESGELRRAYHLFYHERSLNDSIRKAYEYFFPPKQARDSLR